MYNKPIIFTCELNMKYDNIFLKDLLDEGKAILKAQEELDARKNAIVQQKKDYIKDYFNKYGIEDTRTLPMNHNTFISYANFFIRQNDEGKISWIARGKRVTIKDGKVTYGHADEEFWQGQWEALPEGIQKLTIEQAKENSKSVFPMSPAIFNGVDFAAPAYILHENNDGLQLVWRRSGTAYTGRFSGSSASNSGLQILFNPKVKGSDTARTAWDKISEAFNEATGKALKYVSTHVSLTEGGRLSVGLLEKEEQKIDTIFGGGTTQEIIEKLKIQQENKNKKKKELKGGDDEAEPPKHHNVRPTKLKL